MFFIQLKDVARSMVAKADELDRAFLVKADPRAVQGGAICEDADDLRTLARHVRALARNVQNHEEG